MVPLAMRWPPNQTTATLDKLVTSMTAGNMSAISRPAPSDTSNRSSFATANLARSAGSRTKARITRTPAICSRSTLLMASIRSCMSRNSGRILEMIRVTSTPSTGTATTRMDDSFTFWFSARMIPPTQMIGADTRRVKVMMASIWTCCTSLVVRVISDGVPK